MEVTSQNEPEPGREPDPAESGGTSTGAGAPAEPPVHAGTGEDGAAEPNRRERIQALRRARREGQLQIDTDEIARRLLEE